MASPPESPAKRRCTDTGDSAWDKAKKRVFEVRAALAREDCHLGRLESGPTALRRGYDYYNNPGRRLRVWPDGGGGCGKDAASHANAKARRDSHAELLDYVRAELRADEAATMPGLRAAISATEKRIEALREELEEALKAWRDAAPPADYLDALSQ